MSCLRVRCKLFHIFALPSLTSALRPTIVCSFHVFLNVNLKIFCTPRGWSSIVGSLICTSNFCISSDRLSELGHFDHQCNTLICFRHEHHASRQFPMICPQLQWNSDACCTGHAIPAFVLRHFRCCRSPSARFGGDQVFGT